MSKLATITKQRVDPIANAESEHEKKALNIRLSPLAEFVIENVQNQIGSSFTAAGSQLLEAACLDWLEINDHDTSSKEFKAKYFAWLASFNAENQESFQDPETGEMVKARTLVLL
jgi:hypothetical protein